MLHQLIKNNVPGFQKFPIVLIEEFILKESQFLEEDLLDLLAVSLGENELTNVWENHKHQLLISWCSKSGKLFTLFTSVLNSILTRIFEKSSFSKSVNFVAKFVDLVKLKCAESKIDFVLLYPREYHSLVTFLNIHPEMFLKSSENELSVTLETVVELIKNNMASRPIQTFGILTHFPEWAPFVR